MCADDMVRRLAVNFADVINTKRFEEIIEQYRCELLQQMSRSNDGLVSLFLRLSVW